MRHRALVLLFLFTLILFIPRAEGLVSLLDSYDKGNSNAQGTILRVHTGSTNPSESTSVTGRAQSFQFAPSCVQITMIRFELYKFGSPVGVLVAQIYDGSTETVATALPSGAVLAESQSVTMEGLPTSAGTWSNFTLTSFQVYSNAPLAAAVVAKSATTLDDNNYVYVRMDNTPEHKGQNSRFLLGTWGQDVNWDIVFQVEGEEITCPGGTGPGATSEDGGPGFLGVLTDTVTSALSSGSMNGISPVMVIVLAGAAVYLLRPKGKRR